MFKIGNYQFERPVMLAPMEEVTDISYRFLCRELGADVVFTEFVNSDGLVRGGRKSHRHGIDKMKFLEQERPLAIQIYGNDTDNMVKSALMAEEESPDFIDINAGCWVKKVSTRGAGAGLLKDPCFMQSMVKQVVDRVKLPVTVKTRIGWDQDTINILEVAKRLEDVGVVALTVHCRTRSQGHSGDPVWDMVEKIKQVVSIPVILNGGIMTAEDGIRAFDITPCDGIMVARGAIGRPWIFKEIKEWLEYGEVKSPVTFSEKVELCLRHLRAFIELKTERVGIRAFRKFYSGYLSGLPEVAKLRTSLMQLESYLEVEVAIRDFVSQVASQREN